MRAPRPSLLALAVLGLLCSGCASEFGKSLSAKISGNTPIKAAQDMEDKFSPDQRRDGINRLSDRDFARRPPYTTRYEQIAQFDSDWLVRATAIRALNRSRDAAATPIFIKALSDDSELIRIEAIKALNNLPDPNAVPALLTIIADPKENRDARIWAADALRHYHKAEVARILSNQLSAREFGLAWQARQSLVHLTRKDFHYDETAWLQYLTGPEKPFG